MNHIFQRPPWHWKFWSSTRHRATRASISNLRLLMKVKEVRSLRRFRKEFENLWVKTLKFSVIGEIVYNCECLMKTFKLFPCLFISNRTYKNTWTQITFACKIKVMFTLMMTPKVRFIYWKSIIIFLLWFMRVFFYLLFVTNVQWTWKEK